MTTKHLNKIEDYKAYTLLIIDRYNEMMSNINRNYRGAAKLNVKTANVYMASQHNTFLFEYAILSFYLPAEEDKTSSLVALRLIILKHQNEFIQSMINILEQTDILNQNAKNDLEYINFYVEQARIKYIDENIENVKKIMVRLTTANKLLRNDYRNATNNN